MRCPLTVVFLAASLLLFVVMEVAPLHAAEKRAKGRPALPGESCSTPSRRSWSRQEQWVWKRVCEGKIADFNEAKGYGGQLDPNKPEGWPTERILRPTFLETILLHEPYRSALPRQGVRIVGAWFKEPLNLSDARISHQLGLYASRFDSDVNFRNLKTSHFISLQGSKFSGELDMEGLQVAGNLFVREGAKYAAVKLSNLKVEHDLEMSGSEFSGELDMEGLQVAGNLFMREGAKFAAVKLSNAKVERNLEMSGSEFSGELDMEGLQVAGN